MRCITAGCITLKVVIAETLMLKNFLSIFIYELLSNLQCILSKKESEVQLTVKSVSLITLKSKNKQS